MRHSVAILASGVSSQGAISARIDATVTGLQDMGWKVQILDFTPSSPSRARSLLDQLPPRISRLLETAGCEGDVMPSIGRQAKSAASQINTTIAVVTVPPFSLLTATARSLPSRMPLVVDYRDPWSGRLRPPPLARATRQIERRALRRATAVTYAGGPELGRLLSRRLDVPQQRIVAVPNGFDLADLAGVPPYRTRRDLDGNPLDLVFGGYWYGRNGPGILLEALAQVGPEVATLTVIGSISPPILAQFQRLPGKMLRLESATSRIELYKRLARADAAVIPIDNSSATESRIPAKTYDCLAVGTPVIAICPPDSALLAAASDRRFHHVHYRDVGALADLLRRAMRDRATLQPGTRADGPTRQQAAATMHHLLRAIANDTGPAVAAW